MLKPALLLLLFQLTTSFYLLPAGRNGTGTDKILMRRPWWEYSMEELTCQTMDELHNQWEEFKKNVTVEWKHMWDKPTPKFRNPLTFRQTMYLIGFCVLLAIYWMAKDCYKTPRRQRKLREMTHEEFGAWLMKGF